MPLFQLLGMHFANSNMNPMPFVIGQHPRL